MEKITYPLLYYQLRSDLVLGMLVGTRLQVVEQDLKTVKAQVSEFLQKQYKKYDRYPDIDLDEPRMKVIKIPIRPTYMSSSGAYPVAKAIRVPIPVVYGENYSGHYECYLPLLRRHFYYYDPKQFLSLAKNFATNLLSTYEPGKLYQLSLYPDPEMELITLKVNFDRDFHWRLPAHEIRYPTLERLAEKYPYPKSLRRSMSNLPDVAWEMEEKVSEVLEKVLFQRANVLLVGAPGVGKSAVLQQAIRRIANLTKREKQSYSFWKIMPQRITASAKYLGDWEETVENLVEELHMANGVLWVEDIIRLLETGGEGPEDSVAAFLLSYIQQNTLQIVGELSPQELESMRRLLPGFAENFQVIELSELPEKKVHSIFDLFAQHILRQQKVKIEAGALTLAYRLLHRYYPYEQFPGKGIKFLGQCTNEAVLAEKKKIGKPAIVRNFVNQSGLPELFLRDDLLLDPVELHKHFSERIIGQEMAVRKLCDVVKIYKAGLNNPYKPITTLLFAGPTGVGKTACAKALAEYFFGKGQATSPLIRIDMSEFQFPGQISRLIGAGREPGQLVKEVRERPFSVLLLDEVEKADPSIFDALLTVLDEGILVDAYGRVTNFRNTIIIMTTNLGASNRQSIGFTDTTDDQAKYESAIAGFFRPEFVNRIDNVVMFQSLSKEVVQGIAVKELAELNQREGVLKRGITLQFGPGLTKRVIQAGFNPKYGARPLQRAIEHLIVQPLAGWLLEHPKVKNQEVKMDWTEKAGIQFQ